MTRRDPLHFDETHRWFHGPDFLRKSEDEWPETVERTTDGEERSCTTLTLVNKEDSQVVPNTNVEAHKQEGAYTSQKDNRRLEENDRHPLSLNCDYIRRAETLFLLEVQKCFEKKHTYERQSGHEEAVYESCYGN
ncbi:hypothetical protein EVAR_74591_1 [Eumeta japonica]|uniref:Uncharacterized protein n=1 Tax=Eumeta variegata TaxID=151549 RepID=A0A4C1TEV6_EUMVA|nr:hypothetical protein EVAR_74591_1 [Eumeta japonica]